jgi:hypothetical protein
MHAEPRKHLVLLVVVLRLELSLALRPASIRGLGLGRLLLGRP